jgi:hypothetical protein
MSSKLFVSASLISLALVSVGCNSNLSTGHPNAKTPVQNAQKTPAATTPAAGATKTTTAVTPAALSTKSASGTTTLTLNPLLSGTYLCDSGHSTDTCATDESIQVSNDQKYVTLEATSSLGGKTKTATCDQIQKMIVTSITSVDSITGIASIAADVQATILGPKSIDDADCKAALADANSQEATTPITLSIDTVKSANDELHLTISQEQLDLKFSRSADANQ